MANIKDLKVKIGSTKGTLKITSAMKLVSAAKLAKAQAAITGLKPYSNELEKTIRTISVLAKDYQHQYFQESDNNKALLLVISSDKGLCGGYNSWLTKEVKNFLAENKDLDIKVNWVGKKVRDLISKEVNSGKTYTFEKQQASIDEIRKIAEELSEQFEIGEVGKVFVAYNSFNSAISFTSTVKQVLPLKPSDEFVEEIESEFPFDFKYEPSPEHILDTLVPEAYINTVNTAVMDAVASEHGARMNAMENASTNCKEMISTLTLKMNKLRQAAITTELIEVVSGAESLNG